MSHQFIYCVVLLIANTIFTNAKAAAFPTQLDSNIADGIYVELGNGPTLTYPPIFSDPQRYVVGDLNGDGVTEFHYPSGRSSLHIIDGQTRYKTLINIRKRTNGTFRSAGDVDADGDEETLVQSGSQIKYIEGDKAMLVDADTFDLLPDLPISNCQSNSCYANGVGDVDADGFDDIVLVEYGVASAIIYGGPEGLPAARSILELPASARTRIAGFDDELKPVHLYKATSAIFSVGDMNADGASDVLFHRSGNNYSVVLGTPNGREEALDITHLDGSNGFAWKTFSLAPTSIRTGDLNSDGLPDLVNLKGFSNGGGYAIIYGQRDAPGPAGPVNVQQRTGPMQTDFFWTAPAGVSDIAAYIIATDTGYSEHYNADRRSALLDNIAGSIVTFQSVDITGQRSIPVNLKMDDGLNAIPALRAETYGPTKVELFLDNSLPYSEQDLFMVWRNGHPLATSFGNSFIDNSVQANTSYEYVITHKDYRSPAVKVTTTRPSRALAPSVYPPQALIRYARDSSWLPNL